MYFPEYSPIITPSFSYFFSLYPVPVTPVLLFLPLMKDTKVVRDPKPSVLQYSHWEKTSKEIVCEPRMICGSVTALSTYFELSKVRVQLRFSTQIIIGV